MFLLSLECCTYLFQPQGWYISYVPQQSVLQVYNKHGSSPIGFVNLRDINNHLLSFKRSLADELEQMLAIVSSMLVIMVRGVTSKLNYPYAQFIFVNLSGDLVLHPIWKPSLDWKGKDQSPCSHLWWSFYQSKVAESALQRQRYHW